MTKRLRFGTAGLRAPLGEGPACMNVQTVALAANALAQWLPKHSSVVIGRDARHGSEEFANVTARVLIEAGHVPLLFPEPVPTPVVAHEVGRRSEVGAGVMVTASHNPATDNGYKVYTAEGTQLLPADAAIIEAGMDALPWPTEVSSETRSGRVQFLGKIEVDEYIKTIAGPGLNLIPNRYQTGVEPSGLTIVYTAMHGVGADVFIRVLGHAGHRVISVPEQHAPDPDFPTAAFPNPEEPGTLDLAIALAEVEDADLILANDPDADRLAVAVKRQSGWERLTGDEIGVLLGGYLINSGAAGSVATTIVSSSLLAKIAMAAGRTCHTTLTGFKYLSRAADADAGSLLFAYEEALGYAVNPQIRDKDGISAGLVFAELVASLDADQTIDDLLSVIYERHGVHLTSQRSVRFDGDDAMAKMADLMAGLRNDPPTAIGSASVVSITDLVSGTDAHDPADVLIYELVGGRVIVRPSGTEPKIKAYLEAVDAEAQKAKARLAELEEAVAELLTR